MNRNQIIFSTLSMLLLLACLLIPGTRALAVGGSTRVLYINSYSPGFPWSDDIEEAIRERLKASGMKIDISVECMDSRRFPDPLLRERLADMLAIKYARYRHDLVMVSDDAALDFALTYRERLFPALPIVFCGYNNFRPAVLRGATNVTGVNEEVNISDTVDLALQMYPASRHLVFILSTHETSSVRNTLVVEQVVIPRLRGRYRLTVLKDRTMGDLQASLAKLSTGSLVFQVGWPGTTSQGPPLSPLESASLMAAASPVPVYTPWGFSIGSGVLGGRVLTAADQGRVAAELALRILRGESADSIPVVMSLPTHIIFDYRVMKRFFISEKFLPSGSLVINRPQPLWHRYRRQIAAVTVLVIVETLLIASLLKLMRQKRRALDALERERQLLEQRVAERTYELDQQRLQLEESLLTRDSLLDNALVTIALVRERTLVWTSNHIKEMFGYSPEEVLGQNCRFLYADQEEYTRFMSEAAPVLERGESYRGDFRYRRRDWSILWCTVSARPFDPADFSRGILCVVVDIDERKRVEHELQQANALLGMQATTDPLTGLANRRQLMVAIEREISRSERYDHPFSVILMDVDFFKSLNDSFGHDAGDSVLCQIAAMLGEHSRKSDTPGRWGGGGVSDGLS